MSKKSEPFWQKITEKITTVGENIGQQTKETGKKIVEQASQTTKAKVSEVGEKIAEKTNSSLEETWQKAQKWRNSGEEKDWQGEEENTTEPEQEEFYHIFVGLPVSLQGGLQKVTLKSGKTYEVKIRSHTAEGNNLRMRQCGLMGNDAFLVLHTLIESEINLDRQVNNLIMATPIYDQTKTRCLEAYNRICLGVANSDLAALNLLDYLINESHLISTLGLRYAIASNNSRVVGIEQYLQKKWDYARLSEHEMQVLKSTYQYIRSGEPINNFTTVQHLDAIILSSPLSSQLQAKYLLTSATCQALRIDQLIINLLESCPEISDGQRRQYIDIYQKLRSGQVIHDQSVLTTLDNVIMTANIAPICQEVYQLLRVGLKADLELGSEELYFTNFGSYQKIYRSIIPNEKAITVFNDNGSNRYMLTDKAYHAVCRGGVGILDNIKILPAGEALIKAVIFREIAHTAELSLPDKVMLGINVASNFSGAKSWEQINQYIEQISQSESSHGLLSGVKKLLRTTPEKTEFLRHLESQLYSNPQ
jgi:hypothetical protein